MKEDRCDDGATFHFATLMTTFLARTGVPPSSRPARHRPAARQSLTSTRVVLKSTGIIVLIVVAVMVVAALVTGALAVTRRRRLQQRFGPEDDRVAGERDSKLKVESELTERECRVRDLDIQPRTDSAPVAASAGSCSGTTRPTSGRPWASFPYHLSPERWPRRHS